MDVVASVGVLPAEYSEMFHFQNATLSGKVASLLGLKHVFLKESEFRTTLEELIRAEGAEALIIGAIGSNFQKTNIEEMCTDIGIICYTPLWLLDQNMELQAVINSGIKAIIISVSAEGLSENTLGKEIDLNLIEQLNKLNSEYRINVAGEGGEYESLVTSYLDSSIKIKKFHDETRGSMHIRIVENVD